MELGKTCRRKFLSASLVFPISYHPDKYFHCAETLSKTIDYRLIEVETIIHYTPDKKL